MQLGFATDIHLDHVKSTKGYPKQKRVAQALTRGLDALVISGDISIGPFLKDHLETFLASAECPVYFTLGNHDFWRMPLDAVWEAAKGFEGSLDHSDVIELLPDTGLVGLTGWYDTRSGNHVQPSIVMAEFDVAELLSGLGPIRTQGSLFWPPEKLAEVHRRCTAFADTQTKAFLPKLEKAAQNYRKVFIATHFPPWVSSCWGPHGNVGEWAWLPWSVNTRLGMEIEALAEEYPDVQFQVLSGHTHGAGETEIEWNLHAYSGKAQYGAPHLAKVFEINEGEPFWVPRDRA